MFFTGVNDVTDETTKKVTKKNIFEVGQIADKFDQDAWDADRTLLTVWEVTSSGKAARGTTDLTVSFHNPTASKADKADFVGFSLPF